MLESPRNRINGTDEFMVQRSAARILEEMQKSGWTQERLHYFQNI